MKQIVVATDFTAAARSATLYAAELAKTTQARLHIYHAYHTPVITAEVPVMPDMTEFENECYKKLESIGEELNALYGVVPLVKAEMGFAVDNIINYAEQVKADLVVMGMHSHGKVSEVLIGSTTVTFLKRTHTPLLIIPEDAKFSKPERIALATDLREVNIRTLDLMKELADLYDSKILIVNVAPKEQLPDYEKSVAGINLDHYFEERNHLFLFPEGKDPVEGIDRFVEQHKVDWMAVVPHHHNLMEKIFGSSVSKKMAYHTHIPLLILPEKTNE